MTRIILVTFAALAWAWFQMSGGSSFEPGNNGIKVLASAQENELPATDQQVTRNDNNLNAVLVPAASSGAAGTTEPVVATSGNQTEAPTPAFNPSKLVIVSASSEIEPTTSSEPQLVASAVDLRTVSGSRVNLRSGPGTSYGVVTKLVRGDEVEVLEEGTNGWVKLRSLAGSNIGWMASDFLVASN